MQNSCCQTRVREGRGLGKFGSSRPKCEGRKRAWGKGWWMVGRTRPEPLTHRRWRWGVGLWPGLGLADFGAIVGHQMLARSRCLCTRACVCVLVRAMCARSMWFRMRLYCFLLWCSAGWLNEARHRQHSRQEKVTSTTSSSIHTHPQTHRRRHRHTHAYTHAYASYHQ